MPELPAYLCAGLLIGAITATLACYLAFSRLLDQSAKKNLRDLADKEVERAGAYREGYDDGHRSGKDEGRTEARGMQFSAPKRQLTVNLKPVATEPEDEIPGQPGDMVNGVTVRPEHGAPRASRGRGYFYRVNLCSRNYRQY